MTSIPRHINAPGSTTDLEALIVRVESASGSDIFSAA
jgi:hypothetical protein